MKKGNQILTVKISYIIISALTILLGLFLIIYTEISLNVICRILGAALIICGAIKLAGYLSKDLYRLAFEHDLIFAVILCIIGAAALIRPVKIISAMHIAAGIIMLADGIFKVQTAIEAKRFGLGKWQFIALLAVPTLAAGILLIMQPFEAARIMTIIFGAAMIADGSLNLCVAICAIKITKNQVIDAEFYINEERND